MRREIKMAVLITLLALSIVPAKAQTRSSAVNSAGQLEDVVCVVGGGVLWGGRGPDAFIRHSLRREYGGFLTVYMGKARPGSNTCEPPR